MSDVTPVPPVPERPGGGSLPRCVVCERPIVGRVYTLGGRTYDAEHYARATLGSRGSWIATGVLVAGLIVIALFMLAVGPSISDALGKDALVLIGLILAILPVVLWLGVFYQQDRLEPEPKQYLLSVLVVAALLTGTIGEPLRRGFFDLNTWRPENWFYSIVVHTLIQGAIEALIIYAAVRYTVFLSPEFDERADGVIYGTAAGLGVATLLNFEYVLDNHGLNLDVGTARIIVNALLLASIGGVVGYGLGQIKFERHAPWYAAGFVALAAVLGGVFEWLQSEVTREQLGYRAWPAVLLAAIYAVVILGVVFYLLRRAVQETLAIAATPAAAGTEK